MLTTERCDQIMQMIDQALSEYELDMSARAEGTPAPAFARPAHAPCPRRHVDR